MEKLTIVRTNPVQGKAVKVRFLAIQNYEGSVHQAGDAYAIGEFPFPLWLQFEKLIKDGMEARARIETKDTRRIEVEFRPLIELEPISAPVLEPGSIPGRKQREAPVMLEPIGSGYILPKASIVNLTPEPTRSLEERLARSLGDPNDMKEED